MMDQIKQITFFFKFSETRLKVLRSNVANFTNHPNFVYIIDICNTRWVERIIGMGAFNKLFEGILSTIKEMAINDCGKFNADTVSKAVSHRNALERLVWESFWANMQKSNPDSIPDSLEATLKCFLHADGVFTNIEVALRILATIPMTSILGQL